MFDFLLGHFRPRFCRTEKNIESDRPSVECLMNVNGRIVTISEDSYSQAPETQAQDVSDTPGH